MRSERLRDLLAAEGILKTAETHGLRHNMKIPYKGVVLVADTKSDPEWVQLLLDGVPVARQYKGSAGRVWNQGGTNPDYEGFLTYPLESYQSHAGGLNVYDSSAKKGDILYQLIALKRLDLPKPLAGVKTAGKIPEDEKALEALNVLAKKLSLPLFKSLSETEIKMKIPEGFHSLFSVISIQVQWDKAGTWGRVSWDYKHPANMGSNGLNVGSVAYDAKEGKWSWRDDASRSFGYV